MWTRFTWIAAIVVVVAIGFLLACSTNYSASNNGLVVVPSQGSVVMQSFSLNLGNGHLSQINNVKGPPTPGLPTAVVLDPAGNFAYVIVQQNPAVPGGVTGIASFQVASDGKLSSLGTTSVANPVALAIDSGGKFLFIAQGSQGKVAVFSIGANGALTAAGGVSLPNLPGGRAPDASALAVTATAFPAQFAACSGSPAPTTENLYVADSADSLLLNYSVNMSTGELKAESLLNGAPGVVTGTVPSGVAVDPCNRFVYVADAIPNNSVSAYTICHIVSLPNCQNADFSLQPVAGSPFPAGDNPGPLAVDAYGKFLYVVDTGSSQISGYQISPSTGALTAFSGAPVSTNSGPTSIAIRSDDSWMFVANINSASLSQYAITPASGTLTPQPATATFNLPSGVAVK